VATGKAVILVVILANRQHSGVGWGFSYPTANSLTNALVQSLTCPSHILSRAGRVEKMTNSLKVRGFFFSRVDARHRSAMTRADEGLEANALLLLRAGIKRVQRRARSKVGCGFSITSPTKQEAPWHVSALTIEIWPS